VLCINHPNAKAIENCARCETPLCGTCANFTEAGVFCDACEGMQESEELVAARARQLNPQVDEMLAESTDSEDPNLTPSGKSRNKGESVFLYGAGVLTLVLYAGMFLYSHPAFLDSSEEQARKLAAQALEDCVYLFQEIGEILEEGDMPDPSLRCDESNVPNIITRDGDTVRIAHPNPVVHGYSEIFVTSVSHEPTLVE
jgi:hypothetical protein